MSIRSALRTCLANIAAYGPENGPTHKKDWASNFQDGGKILNATTDESFVQELGGEDEEDAERLDRPYQDDLPSEECRSEGDSATIFAMYFSKLLRSAFDEMPHIFVTSQPSPIFPIATQKVEDCTVDTGFTIKPPGAYAAGFALIGELKRPGTIRPIDFGGTSYSTSKRKTGGGMSEDLCREMRGYAYHYVCPQTFVYDGRFLLILDFLAYKHAELLTCGYNTWLIDLRNFNRGISERMALYRLLRKGVHRVIGFNTPDLPKGQLTRVHEWRSGRLYWTKDGQTEERGFSKVWVPMQVDTDGSVSGAYWLWLCEGFDGVVHSEESMFMPPNFSPPPGHIAR